MAGTSLIESVGTRVPVLDATTALSTARDLRDQLAVGASERDSQRILPARELETLSRSGLLGITVPAAYGGADLPTEVVAEVFALLAAGDPNVAQIPHSHFVYVNVLRHHGTPAQRAFFFGEVLAGPPLRQRPVRGRHQDGPRPPHDAHPAQRSGREAAGCSTARRATAPGPCSRTGSRCSRTSGRTARCTSPGSSAPRRGVSVVDDWDGMGQRTTASGTVRLVDVEVDDSRITPYAPTFERPADLRRVRPGAARRARRRHRPGRPRRGRRVRDDQEPALPGRRGRAARRRPAGRAGLRRDGARGARRRGAGARGRPRRRPRGRRPHRRVRGAASLAVAAARAATTQGRGRRDHPAVRGRRHPVGAGQPQPAPALAQRPHPHAPRPGGLEGAAPRSLRPRRHAAAQHGQL